MKGVKSGMSASQSLSHIILLSSAALLSFNTYSAEPVPVRENKFIIGGGFVHNSVPYAAMDSLTEPVPLFDVQFGPLFANNRTDEPVVGIELFRHKRVMLALAAVYGNQYLDVSEASKDKEWLYLGIEDRDKATEAALIFHFYSKVGLVDIRVHRDISNTYDGFRSSISWSRPFPETGNWTVTPRMYGRYYSVDFNNYYYGVSSEEMDRAEAISDANSGRVIISGEEVSWTDYRDIYRPAYEAENAGQFGVDLTVDYHFTEHFMAQGYVGMEQLAGQVTSSTLTEDADIWKVSLGLALAF